MATSYVVDGATLKCSKGGTCKLKVAPGRKTFIEGKLQANVNDYTTKSIPKFNFCSIPKHHQCRLSLQGPWKSGKNDVIIEGAPALMHSSKIKCVKGGVISIQKHNQCLESDGALVLPVKEPAKQEFERVEKSNNMSYQTTQDFLTKNDYSRPGTPIKKVNGVVVHWVANAGSTAKQNRDYFESLKVGKKIYVKNKKNELIWNGKYVYASAHYIVDLDGSIIQALPENEVAYHVGAKEYKKVVEERLENRPNSLTLGIEMTHIDNVGNFTNDTYRSTTILASKLLAKYNLNPYKDLYRHYDITGKDCPKLFVTNTEKWMQFVKDVANIMEYKKK